MTKNYYIEINNIKIPANIRNYKNAKSIKIYFKDTVLNVTKPYKVTLKLITEIIRKNEKQIYEQYQKSLENYRKNIINWKTGEIIYYKGEKYVINRTIYNKTKLGIEIDINKNRFNIYVPEGLEELIIKKGLDNIVKKIFKNNTEVLLQDRLPYWSKITKIQYNQFKVRDAISKYGSCVPKTRMLHFTSRLIMLPPEQIDAIIVHELCHIIHPNHSKEFYNLVKRYIPDYDIKRKWLKENSNIILI